MTFNLMALSRPGLIKTLCIAFDSVTLSVTIFVIMLNAIALSVRALFQSCTLMSIVFRTSVFDKSRGTFERFESRNVQTKAFVEKVLYVNILLLRIRKLYDM
jgi:hypothetical protein